MESRDRKRAKRKFLIWWGIILGLVVPILALLLAMPIVVAFTEWYWMDILPFMIFIDSVITVVLAALFLLIVQIQSGMRWFQVFGWEAILGIVLFCVGIGIFSFLVANPVVYSCPATACPVDTTRESLSNSAILIVLLAAVFLFHAIVALRMDQPD